MDTQRIEELYGVLPPTSFGRNRSWSWARGFTAASYGMSVNACGETQPWQREAWSAGHAAYHHWLQAHRTRACDRDEGAPAGAGRGADHA